jgi:hypothetical protein
MNVSKSERLYLRLAALEREYLEALVKILGGNDMGFSSLSYFTRKSSNYRVGKKWGNDGVDHIEHLEKEIRQLSAKLNEPIKNSAVGVVEEYAEQRSNSEAASEDKALERTYHQRLIVMFKKLKEGT